MDTLANCNIHNVQKFTLKNLETKCKICRILDGDTIDCILHLFGNNYIFTIRLGDIDTCEMKSKNEENKNLALQARKRLCELISDDLSDIPLNISKKDLNTRLNTNNYIVNIRCGDFDKYGRLIGWLFKEDAPTDIPIEESFNYILINEKLAYKYEGKTKLTEEEQLTKLHKN